MGATARRLRRPVTDQTGVGGTAPRARACPGQLSASSGLRPIRTRRAATRSGGPYGGPCTDATAPRRHSPNRRRSVVPGPRPVAPHAVPGGPGHPSAHPFHISLAGWRILARWPPPRSTYVLRGRRARGGCHAWATIASSPACARETTRRSRSSSTATTRACWPSAGTCSAVARRRRMPCSTASPRRIGLCAAARATSSCAPGCTRSRAIAASRPCGRSARRSPPTGWRPSPAPSRGCRPRFSSGPTCASSSTSCSACPRTSARRSSSSSSATSPMRRSPRCSGCAARRSRRSCSRPGRR